MESLTGIVVSQNGWNGGWLGYRPNAVYAGTNSSRCYTCILQFTIPEFIGVSSAITFTISVIYGADVTPTLRYALCTSDANLNSYVDTNEEVVDSYQLECGTFTMDTLTGGKDNRELVINTNRITSGGTYYLYLWGYSDNSTPEWVTVYGTEYHSVALNYNQGLIRIDNGSGFDMYMVCIDNGTSWDQCMPYLDNGTSWEIGR